MMIPSSGRMPSKSGYGSKKKHQPIPALPGPIVVTKICWGEREIPLSYGGHVRGWHHVRPDHKQIQFESLIERDTITALARYPEVEVVISQPVTIYYRIGDQAFNYTPDLLVRVGDMPMDLEILGFDQWTFVECKPEEVIADQRNVIDRHFRALQLAFQQPIVLITRWDLSQGVLRDRHA